MSSGENMNQIIEPTKAETLQLVNYQGPAFDPGKTENPTSAAEVAEFLVEGKNVQLAEVLFFYPPKKSHRPCYGRGYLGTDLHTKEIVLCSCVNKTLLPARQKYLDRKLAAIQLQALIIKQTQARLDAAVAESRTEAPTETPSEVLKTDEEQPRTMHVPEGLPVTLTEGMEVTITPTFEN